MEVMAQSRCRFVGLVCMTAPCGFLLLLVPLLESQLKCLVNCSSEVALVVMTSRLHHETRTTVLLVTNLHYHWRFGDIRWMLDVTKSSKAVDFEASW